MREFHALIVDFSRRFLPLVVKYPWFLPWNNTNKVREKMILVSVETSCPSSCQYILTRTFGHVSCRPTPPLPAPLICFCFYFFLFSVILKWERRERERSAEILKHLFRCTKLFCYDENYLYTSFSTSPSLYLCYLPFTLCYLVSCSFLSLPPHKHSQEK